MEKPELDAFTGMITGMLVAHVSLVELLDNQGVISKQAVIQNLRATVASLPPGAAETGARTLELIIRKLEHLGEKNPDPLN